jgi:hypothetical protein
MKLYYRNRNSVEKMNSVVTQVFLFTLLGTEGLEVLCSRNIAL